MDNHAAKSLVDNYGRRISYLRISVTERCDLRCGYCMPHGSRDTLTPENGLSFVEIERVVRIMSELGVKRVRITGGEPLLRKDLPQLTQKLSLISGIEDISLSTNGMQLERHAEGLFHGGVQRLNVSLDSLDCKKYRALTGGGKLEKVLAGLMRAREVGFSPIKINMVVMQGENDSEIIPMVEFCLKYGFTLRFIETMPIGKGGQEASQHYMSMSQVKTLLSNYYEMLPAEMLGGGPAEYLSIKDSELKIGFITPISQHFCATCNRVRLTAAGILHTCLGQEHQYPLAPLLRSNLDDQELEQSIRDAIALKPYKHEFIEKPLKMQRMMSTTGG